MVELKRWEKDQNWASQSLKKKLAGPAKRVFPQHYWAKNIRVLSLRFGLERHQIRQQIQATPIYVPKKVLTKDHVRFLIDKRPKIVHIIENWEIESEK